MISRQARDRLAIRDLIDNWAIWRDSGRWDHLALLWHDDGRMVTTWCECSAREFIDLCKTSWSTGISAVHSLGGTSIELAGARAVAETKVTLTQRALLHGVQVDVTCMGRFYDLLERRGERWALVLRHPIYEMDRIDSLSPAASLRLDEAKLAEFPEGYRHLAYLQTSLGMSVNRGLPGRAGPEVELLYERGREWLAAQGSRG